MEGTERRERKRWGAKTPVQRILALRELSLPELYEIFQGMRVLHGEEVVKQFKDILGRLYEDEYGDVLTLDDKALIADTPDRLVGELATRLFDMLVKHYSESDVATTAGSVKYEASRRAEDLLARALRLLIVIEGWA